MTFQAEGRLLTLEEATRTANELRALGRRLVLTNGVFDLLHAGHVTYLAAARRLGEYLIVGLNSDASTSSIKGQGRPIVPQADRATVLLALRAVDAVIIFDEATASNLVIALQPDIYVKGGDYSLGGSPGIPLPEEPAVRAYGGGIALISTLEGRSTTQLAMRARKLLED